MEDNEINELLKLEGVGKAKAEILYNAGFKTVDSLKKGSFEEIAEIKGIGEKLATQIKESANSLDVEETGQPEKAEEKQISVDLDDETKRLLNVRKKQKSKKPDFKQADSHKKKKLADHWRKPRGLHNKSRKQVKGKNPLVKAGYGSPASVRGFHPSGFEDVIVTNLKDLESLKADSQAARISGTVGSRKRSLIENRAAELGLKVLNPTRGEESNE